MKLIYPEKFVLPEHLVLKKDFFKPKGLGVDKFLRALKFTGVCYWNNHRYHYKNGTMFWR